MARDIAEIRRDIEETRARLRDTAEAIGWKADVPSRARDVMRETVAVVRERVASGSSAPAHGTGGDSGGLRQRVSSIGSAIGERLDSAKETVAQGGSATAHGASSVKETIAEGAGSVGRAASALKDAASAGAGSTAGALEHAQEAVSDRLPDRDQARAGVGMVASGVRANPVGLAIGALALGAAVGVLLPSTRVEDERLGGAAGQLKERGAELGQTALEKGRDAVDSVSSGIAPGDDAGGADAAAEQQVAAHPT
jgi:hypothetical protein